MIGAVSRKSFGRSGVKSLNLSGHAYSQCSIHAARARPAAQLLSHSSARVSSLPSIFIGLLHNQFDLIKINFEK
jgi:hypothetical protein